MRVEPLASSSTANCTHLTNIATGSTMLLDAGLTIPRLRERLAFRVSQLSLVAVTHCHGDHARGVKGLLKAGVTCAMLPETAEALGLADHHRVMPLAPGESVAVDGWEIRPFEVQHDVPAVGFTVRVNDAHLLYLTDAGKMPEITQVAPFTHVLIEANHRAAELEWRYEAGEQHITRVMNNHLSLEAAMEGVASLALAPGAEVWLTHMSASHGHAVDFQAEMQAALGERANVLVAPE